MSPHAFDQATTDPHSNPPQTHKNGIAIFANQLEAVSDLANKAKEQLTGLMSPEAPTPDIIDIRRERAATSIKESIFEGMWKPPGERSLPTMLLYSAEGLKLFEEITYLEEYYLTNMEIALLEKHAESIAERIEDGSVLVELGSGNLRKVNILLKAIDRAGKTVDYYALDLDLGELNRTLSAIDPSSFRNVRCHGLHGTYDEGRAWLKESPELAARPRCVLWLGSSAGNFTREEAAVFLKEFADDALRPGTRDCMLIGLDGCKDGDRVWRAYNDPQKVTERFIMAGLKNANTVLGDRYFDVEEWEYKGEWNAEIGRHQAYYIPKIDIEFTGNLEGVKVKAGEKIHIEYSYKFDDKDAAVLWESCKLRESAKWANDSGYALCLVQRPDFFVSSRALKYAAQPVPSLEEWEELLKSWKAVTLGMIPNSMLLSKPIDLRNPCIFYLGHIPTFMDHLLNLASGAPPTEPAYFLDIFQRGIDPDVDDPEKCHSHSKNPDCWPDLKEILDYSDRVHARLESLYDVSGSVGHLGPKLQRAIWTAFEHEAMHLETLLYMLLQSDSTLPPPRVLKPDFVSSRAVEIASSSDDYWTTLPSSVITVGMDDPESSPDTTGSRHFGWDNEKPARQNVRVESFTIRSYPITNGEYAKYLESTGSSNIPASWVEDLKVKDVYLNGDVETINNVTPIRSFMDRYSVRTVFGPVPLKLALDWPAIASFDELNSCVKWMGGHIPTADQVRAVYEYVENSDAMVENTLSQRVDAVNGHLSHNGVCETPPSGGHSAEEETEEGLFVDLVGKNIGFAKWHPTSVRAAGKRLLGRGELGGAWEWTSTVLEKEDGFVPGELYPEYTADFFDGKHNIVLGASWATHPRIGGRKSFVNWYQRNYRYMWATARIVKD